MPRRTRSGAAPPLPGPSSPLPRVCCRRAYRPLRQPASARAFARETPGRRATNPAHSRLLTGPHMFLAEIDRLLKAHAPHWRRAIFFVFVLSATHSAASVLRPLPIKALVEPPPPDTWWGGIERTLT